MKKIINKYPILLLILVSIGLFALNLGELKVSIMEARNFIVAREMLTESHWLLTTMNDIARYEKPPFPAWFSAPFAYIFGYNNVWAYRIPTSIFSILGVVYFYKLVKLWLSTDLAFYTALVLATSFYYIVIRFEAPSDIYTHVNMIIGLYYLVNHHPQIRLKDMFIGGIFLGFSILSKGPVSPYALFLPFILAYFISFKMDFKSQLLKVFGFLGTGLIIGGSWYLYVRFADPQTLLEIAEKETGNWTSYNTRPFYYYWSFFIQSGIWTIPAFLSLLYPYFSKRVEHQKIYKFSFLWTILALVLLSIIPEKKPRYLVPVLFPLAFNTVLILQYMVNHKKDLFSKFFHYLHYPIIILVCLGMVFSPFILDLEWNNIWLAHIVMSASSLTIAFFTIKFLKEKRFAVLFWSNILIILLITMIGQSQVRVLKKNEDYLSLATLSTDKSQAVNSFYYGSLAPEVIWTYGKTLKPLSSGLNVQEPYQILVTEENLKDFNVNYPNIVKQSEPRIFDENYFRAGQRKRSRFLIYIFEKQ